MKNQPLVSIVIPFYNRFDLLINTLNSVSNQTYTYYEVILIDDFSDTVPNMEIIKQRFNFPVLKYERLLENIGPGGARRRGREMAEGEYIVYLDSDDWWSDNFLGACVENLIRNSSVGMVYTNTITLLNKQEVFRRVDVKAPATDSIVPFILYRKRRPWSTASCMWRREVSLANHWLSLRNNEDYIHDIMSSRINNRVLFVEQGATFKNQSAEQRIPRDKEEVKKALMEVASIKNMDCYKGFSYFITSRLYEFKIKINGTELFRFGKITFLEYKRRPLIAILSWSLYVCIGVMGVRSYKLKKAIMFLK